MKYDTFISKVNEPTKHALEDEIEQKEEKVHIDVSTCNSSPLVENVEEEKDDEM